MHACMLAKCLSFRFEMPYCSNDKVRMERVKETADVMKINEVCVLLTVMVRV